MPEPNSTVFVLSKRGISYLPSLVLVFVLFITFIVNVVQAVKDILHNRLFSEILFPVVNMLYTIVLYTVINTRYDIKPYFETRYLIFSLLFFLPLCGNVLENLTKGISKKLFNGCILIGMCLLLVVSSLISYQRVFSTKFSDPERLEEIVGKMDELNAEIVYFYGDDTQKDTQTILVIDETNRVYDCLFENMSSIHWGNPIDHRVHYQKELSSVILTKSDSLFQHMPYGITRFYTHVDRLQNIKFTIATKIIFSLQLHFLKKMEKRSPLIRIVLGYKPPMERLRKRAL